MPNLIKIQFKTHKYSRINQKPEGGTCTMSPREGVTLVTDFNFYCEEWEDPEDIGIKQYTTISKHFKDYIELIKKNRIYKLVDFSTVEDVATGKQSPLAKFSEFNPDDPEKVQMKLGIYKVLVTVEDMWGAETGYALDYNIVV